jgi:DMSO reductase anchor subunit
MEKKIDKRFYILSAINLIPAAILGDGLTMNTLVLAISLGVLVINHTVLVKMVSTLTTSLSGSASASRSTKRLLFLMVLKFTLLGASIGIVYFYNKDLIPKLMLLMIFQLIIQVVSIKNNYQNL